MFEIIYNVVGISGGPCKESSYILEQFHLHWGETDAAGSEHLVNSRPHSAEVKNKIQNEIFNYTGKLKEFCIYSAA